MVFEPTGLKLAWFMNYLPLAKNHVQQLTEDINETS